MVNRYICIFSLLLVMCYGHIRLTWPPARAYDLDWLDNIRTSAPCGMKPGPVMTTFQKGTSFNATWHVASPHDGGFRIDILEGNTVVFDLTNGFISADDVTLVISLGSVLSRLSYRVQLPVDYTCNNCTLRIVRQALNYGPTYQFWTCSDISIINVHTSDCSNHGSIENGKCKCEPLFRGSDCQYKDECDTNTDCSNHGACVTTDSTFYPKMQCFCDAGWFGESCEKKSAIDEVNLDANFYESEIFANGDFKIFWRILQDTAEIEIGMTAKGESYAAVGFRPKSMAACTYFANPGANAKPWRNNPAPEGSTPAPEKSTPVPEGSTPAAEKSTPVPEGSTPAPEKSTPVPEGSTPAAEKSTPVPEGSTPVPEGSTPVPEGSSSPSHPMDCTDIIIGTAIGKRSRIGDYYTRDRSSPRKDSVYGPGGENSLTSAVGMHENGFTTIVFRRKLLATERQDHSIARGAMHVVWARGHMPSYTVLRASDKHYYKKFDIKYHGGSGQRGYKDIDFHRNTATASAGLY